jgi:hypothetical protein
MLTKTCRGCGREFEAATTRAFYCPGECFRKNERLYSRRRRKTFSRDRQRASNLVYTAVRQGTLVPQPCEVCGRGRADAHHDDYAAPLAVRWLCRSHHRQHHHQFGPGRNA